MDEHSGALPQPTGDIQVLLFAFLRGLQEDYQSLPWNTRRGSAGSGAGIQRPRYKVQRYSTVTLTFTCWSHMNWWMERFSVVSEYLNAFSSTHHFVISNKDDDVFLFHVEEVMQTTYCEIDLDKAKRDAFVYAIKNHYWYQMYIDDLPIWGKWCFISFAVKFSGSVYLFLPFCLSNLFANLLIPKGLRWYGHLAYQSVHLKVGEVKPVFIHWWACLFILGQTTRGVTVHYIMYQMAYCKALKSVRVVNQTIQRGFWSKSDEQCSALGDEQLSSVSCCIHCVIYWEKTL